MEGETVYWHRLAELQGRSFQECQDSNTSTEFVRWQVYFDLFAWKFTTKDQAQLAVVASEVRRLTLTLGAIFGAKDKLPALKDFFLEIETDKPAEPPPCELEIEEVEWERPEPEAELSGIEIGQPLDEKWEKVNDSINSEFAMFAALLGGGATYTPAGEASGGNSGTGS